MTQYPSADFPEPGLSYQVVDPRVAADAGHLRLLSIFHYIWGPLVMVFSCIFIVYIVLGVMMLKNPGILAEPPGAPPLPEGFAWIFIVMGSVAVLFGWTIAILNIVAGRAITRRKWRIFTLVIAGFNCLLVPFGTAVGVFTFVVLLRESVRLNYEGDLPPGVPMQPLI